jgi:predicted nucleotidyltransferase
MSDRRGKRTQRRSLADTLFTRTQQRVLGLLFGQPDRSFYASELIRRTGTGSGAAQRELARLESGGLITGHRVGQQKHYQANPTSPLFSELRGIVMKTVGLAEPIRTALGSMSRRIRAAFVYGSVAKGGDRAESDIDLLVISDSLTYGEVFEALESAGRVLGRPISPTVYSVAELTKRSRAKSSFVTRILAQPKVWIIGGEDDIPA